MPKLIILNGPLGIGKTTLAKRYVKDHGGSVYIDIDDLRKTIPNWREQAESSAAISKAQAVEMARQNLANGYDVIIPQIYRGINYLDQLERLADDYNAHYYEVLLYDTKENARRRFIERGQREGKPLGYNPEGLIGKRGGANYLDAMFDEMMVAADQRSSTIRISSIEGDEESTYQKLLKSI